MLFGLLMQWASMHFVGRTYEKTQGEWVKYKRIERQIASDAAVAAYAEDQAMRSAAWQQLIEAERNWDNPPLPGQRAAPPPSEPERALPAMGGITCPACGHGTIDVAKGLACRACGKL